MNRPGAPTRCGPPLFEDRYSLRLAAGDGVLRVTRKEGVGRWPHSAAGACLLTTAGCYADEWPVHQRRGDRAASLNWCTLDSCADDTRSPSGQVRSCRASFGRRAQDSKGAK
jgi:hypothetical protein